jgi:hypothetical protein
MHPVSELPMVIEEQWRRQGLRPKIFRASRLAGKGLLAAIDK